MQRPSWRLHLRLPLRAPDSTVRRRRLYRRRRRRHSRQDRCLKLRRLPRRALPERRRHSAFRRSQGAISTPKSNRDSHSPPNLIPIFIADLIMLISSQPDRPDELNRIQEAGGRVIFWDGPRVLGVLAMSRAIGKYK